MPTPDPDTFREWLARAFEEANSVSLDARQLAYSEAHFEWNREAITFEEEGEFRAWFQDRIDRWNYRRQSRRRNPSLDEPASGTDLGDPPRQ